MMFAQICECKSPWLSVEETVAATLCAIAIVVVVLVCAFGAGYIKGKEAGIEESDKEWKFSRLAELEREDKHG